ncbi:VWA domain-containing protein [Gimesia algae]|uniref:von Willebrand factor type A domain protein n=1 Tax=Gimesia algae TaxID=2527971 RepID=A0A517V739_9PLAN|nr:VWA domain-containing protein [Gimesia algae]QDT88826.1 von Willebrand factor type A domain protein [Gimesia algae]
MDIQFGNPTNIILLIVAAGSLLLAGYAAVAKHRAARQFASANMSDKLFLAPRFQKHWISSILVVSSLCLLAVALCDIRWGKTEREVPQKGIEVMFLLDVSRSMLAEDVSPSRLDRAKQQIKDMVDEMSGDRVGLVVFAGETRQSVPLTSHYEDFKQTLDTVGPHSVRRGGSLLGDAIRAATAGFINKTNDHKAIVVFTDGEDQESKPVEAAKEAFTKDGIRFFTVGLGDMDQGARIPDIDQGGQEFVEYQGQAVWSKMNGTILSQIATDTNGAYIPAGTKQVDMADVYHNYVANIEQTEFETATISAYTPRFQWFALPACLLLLLEVLYSTARRKKKSLTPMANQVAKNNSTTEKSSVPKSAVAALLVLVTLSMSTGRLNAAETDVPSNIISAKQINTANQFVREGKFAEALEEYQQIEPTPHHQAELNYNEAVTMYRQGNMEQAAHMFTAVAGDSETNIAARARYNLGNCHYTNGMQLAEQDKPAAIEQFKTAIEHYRGALRGNPNNADARANIELAAQFIKDLQEQQKEEQQQQQDKEQQKDQQQQSQDQQKPNENQEQKSDEQQKQDQQSEQNQKQSEEQKSESESEQQQQSSKGEPQEKSQEPQPGEEQNPSEKSGSENKQMQPQSQQSKDAEQSPQPPEQNKPEDKEDPGENPVPTGELTSDQAQPTEENPKSGYGIADPNEKPGLMNKEEALKLLQSVRDRNMLRRLRQQQLEKSRQVHVDRNW